MRKLVFPLRVRVLAGLLLISINVSFDVVRNLLDPRSFSSIVIDDVPDVPMATAVSNATPGFVVRNATLIGASDDGVVTSEEMRTLAGKPTNVTSQVVPIDLPDLTMATAAPDAVNNATQVGALDDQVVTSEEELQTLVVGSNSLNMSNGTGFDPTLYAYAYVIGGCNPNDGKYKGFLYNILVSTRILREEGSAVDVVAMFQISSNTNATELPPEDIQVLSSMGVKTIYIPKAETDSFYDTVMNKFRILSLVQYRRVLLMDGDVMPIGNLDFLFELSDDDGTANSTALRENVVIMGKQEPANGGFFMLAPGAGEYEQLQDIIRTREINAASLEIWPKFDPVSGWGHAIEKGDEWVTRTGEKGTNWTFHFAFSDQGLLYHWTKYAKQSVSIVSADGHGGQSIQNWAPSESGKVVLERIVTDSFVGRSKPRYKDYFSCTKFLCDFVHFTGSEKPWMKQPPANMSLSNDYAHNDAHQIWWYTLYALNDEYGMGLNFTHWTAAQTPPLGLYATFHQVENRIKKLKTENNITAA